MCRQLQKPSVKAGMDPVGDGVTTFPTCPKIVWVPSCRRVGEVHRFLHSLPTLHSDLQPPPHIMHKGSSGLEVLNFTPNIFNTDPCLCSSEQTVEGDVEYLPGIPALHRYPCTASSLKGCFRCPSGMTCQRKQGPSDHPLTVGWTPGANPKTMFPWIPTHAVWCNSHRLDGKVTSKEVG